MPMDMESLAKQMVGPAAKGVPEEGPAEMADDSMPMDGKQMAAEEMMAAFQSSDPKGLASALENFVQMCMTEYGGEE